MMQATKFTKLQLELLRLFSREIPDEELLEIKRMLADHFASKLTKEAEKVWDEKGFSDEDMDRWLREVA